MRKFFKRSKSSKILIMGVIVALCFAVTGWAKAGQDREEREFTDFTHIEEEYLSTLKSLDFPEGRYSRKNWKGKIVKRLFRKDMEKPEPVICGNTHGCRSGWILTQQSQNVQSRH